VGQSFRVVDETIACWVSVLVTTDNNATRRDPVKLLERLLELVLCNYSTYGSTYPWQVSRDFFDFDFSDWETIEEEFWRDYEVVAFQVQQAWGLPNFRGSSLTLGYPEWYWISVIEMCYWTREEGIAYISFHREDRELPYEITLGAITEMAIEEIIELGLNR